MRQFKVLEPYEQFLKIGVHETEVWEEEACIAKEILLALASGGTVPPNAPEMAIDFAQRLCSKLREKNLIKETVDISALLPDPESK